MWYRESSAVVVMVILIYFLFVLLAKLDSIFRMANRRKINKNETRGKMRNETPKNKKVLYIIGESLESLWSSI